MWHWHGSALAAKGKASQGEEMTLYFSADCEEMREHQKNIYIAFNWFKIKLRETQTWATFRVVETFSILASTVR